MVSREDVVNEARSWVGTPWQHQQYTKGLAADCIGLIGGVALVLGLPGAKEWHDNPAYHSYGRMPDPKLLISGCELLMDPIEHYRYAQLADILVFRFRRYPQHFAIISQEDPLYVIHSYAQAGKVTENRVDMVHGIMRPVAAYHLRGVV